ncbi:DUF3043 domain-containing protein [Actinomyces israelii]|uniref:DUF3043 domain-containing protein n=1 Tax=Actinomyces israelii TaxID=1659 RepID=A0ABT4I7H0_9ACTO|nr:DUF3043 domain-containing protein [Actinomyces israelii]MCZ0857461.1 DUF3043 domain-containing protein [Actinomyces israelii]WKR21499.1 hypothetical protein AIF0345_1412 [Actinomyces israelii]
MKLFKKRAAAPEPEPAVETPVKSGGKGRATPKRRDAEARRLHPVVPTDRKAAKAQARAKQDEAWRRQREAMRTGDERYLPARDKGPVKRYIRDYVDARFSLGEAFMPLSILLIVVMIGIQTRAPGVGLMLIMGLYAVFLLSIVDAVVCWWLLRRRLHAKFGEDRVKAQGTVFWYIFSRCFNLRRWRQPSPQVARRQYPS